MTDQRLVSPTYCHSHHRESQARHFQEQEAKQRGNICRTITTRTISHNASTIVPPSYNGPFASLQCQHSAAQDTCTDDVKHHSASGSPSTRNTSPSPAQLSVSSLALPPRFGRRDKKTTSSPTSHPEHETNHSCQLRTTGRQATSAGLTATGVRKITMSFMIA